MKRGPGRDADNSTPTTCSSRAWAQRLGSWPPPADFPVAVDSSGRVLSRYGDSRWTLTPLMRKSFTLNFGDGRQRKDVQRVSRLNADLLRQIAAWWLWGPRRKLSPICLHTRVGILRPLFVLCTNEGVSASALARHPAVVDKLHSVFPPSRCSAALSLLHILYGDRDELGFVLLDPQSLKRLDGALPEHAARQTPYIPPRIWLYQYGRLREFLEDFQLHADKVEACYRFCAMAYARNYGSLPAACMSKRVRSSGRAPFGNKSDLTGAISGAKFHGPFSETASRFGIHELLSRWCLQHGERITCKGRGVRAISTYLSMASCVGIAYLLNLSMMRIEEAWSLRTDCLEVENDERIGPVYLLKGKTTKTLSDSDARWVTSPSAVIAVEVLSRIARLRMAIASKRPGIVTSPDEERNPYLCLRGYEPWCNAVNSSEPIAVRPHYPSYQSLVSRFPKLFDRNELKIAREDLDVARLITPTLGGSKFGTGKEWPLSWHQLRRTGAVNMQASGLVSDASLQYQLKHASRAMSYYYARGYSRVALNDQARDEYIRTMYEIVGKQISRLFSERYVSPHGENRKREILRAVSPRDSDRLADAAKAGKVSWRETLLGGCTKRGPCAYGGVDNITRCAGSDGRAPCADALFDRDKIPAIHQLGRTISMRLLSAPEGSPYRESLERQQLAVEHALGVLTHD